MLKLIVYGAGCPDIVKIVSALNRERDQAVRIVGFIDDLKWGVSNHFLDYPIIGIGDHIKHLLVQYPDAQVVNNVFSSTQARLLVTNKILNAKGCLATIISPDVDCSLSSIGPGTVIMPAVQIGAKVKIGAFVGIRTGACINHECEIGDHTFIGPAAILCGRVKVGVGSYVGAGAIIRENISVGKNSTIGMGSVVVADVPSNVTVVGNPARSISSK